MTWVNTIGMRPPSLNWASLSRGREKISQWLTTPQPAPSEFANPQIVNPRMWPWFRRRWDRALNQRLMLRSLVPIVERQAAPVVAVTTIPIVADLIGKLPVSQWVYYCVDDFSHWPGLDQQTMRIMEAELLERVDVAVAVSEKLQDKLASAGHNAHLLTHGVDLDFWQAGGGTSVSYEQFERPLVVFWGVIDQRMDVAFVHQLDESLDKGTILLVGPQQAPDPKLASSPRTVLLPSLPYDELPSLGQQADVLIMPYQDLPVTRAMQPLKLKEYLATGKPVVVRKLPATQAWGDALDQATTADEFARLVKLRLAEGITIGQRQAREKLQESSWEAKARQFEQMAMLEVPDKVDVARSVQSGYRVVGDA